MPQQPNIEQVHVNKPLTIISLAYMQSQREFIADRVFPTVPVEFKSDVFYNYTRDEWFRNGAKKRAPATESAGSGYNVDNTGTYNCDVYALHKDVDDMTRANSDTVLNPDRDATNFVTAQLLLAREEIFVTKSFQTGIWTGSAGGTDLTGVAGVPGANQFKQWDQAGSTPIEDIQKAALDCKSKTGLRPNVLTLGPYVALQLVNNPEIIDRIKYTQAGFPDYSLLARAFGVEEVVVPECVINTGAEAPYTQGSTGYVTSTWSPQFVYGKQALLSYRPAAPGLMVPSAGYCFAWKGYLGGTSWMQIVNFRIQRLRSMRVEGELAMDVQNTGKDLGVFFTSCVA